MFHSFVVSSISLHCSSVLCFNVLWIKKIDRIWNKSNLIWTRFRFWFSFIFWNERCTCNTSLILIIMAAELFWMKNLVYDFASSIFGAVRYHFVSVEVKLNFGCCCFFFRILRIRQIYLAIFSSWVNNIP